jgi:hypothetical protein
MGGAAWISTIPLANILGLSTSLSSTACGDVKNPQGKITTVFRKNNNLLLMKYSINLGLVFGDLNPLSECYFSQ